MARHPSPPAQTVPARQSYRVTNWSDYNRALVARGAVTLWLHEQVLRDWRATGGRGKRYSDAAILCGLSLRAIFKLPLRQTQGFLGSRKSMLGLTIEVPHYSTLSRRAGELVVPSLPRGARGEPVHLAIDSTGLKLFGEGEWSEADQKTGWGPVFPPNPPAWQGKTPGLAQAASGRGYRDRRDSGP